VRTTTGRADDGEGDDAAQARKCPILCDDDKY
jgi:hypothetical protein